MKWKHSPAPWCKSKETDAAPNFTIKCCHPRLCRNAQKQRLQLDVPPQRLALLSGTAWALSISLPRPPELFIFSSSLTRHERPALKSWTPQHTFQFNYLLARTLFQQDVVGMYICWLTPSGCVHHIDTRPESERRLRSPSLLSDQYYRLVRLGLYICNFLLFVLWNIFSLLFTLLAVYFPYFVQHYFLRFLISPIIRKTFYQIYMKDWEAFGNFKFLMAPEITIGSTNDSWNTWKRQFQTAPALH